MFVLAGVLGLLALAVGSITTAIFGTILLTNTVASNYEQAGRISFFVGLFASGFILCLNAGSFASFMAASLWMAGIGVALVGTFVFWLRMNRASDSDSNSN